MWTYLLEGNSIPATIPWNLACCFYPTSFVYFFCLTLLCWGAGWGSSCIVWLQQDKKIKVGDKRFPSVHHWGLDCYPESLSFFHDLRKIDQHPINSTRNKHLFNLSYLTECIQEVFIVKELLLIWSQAGCPDWKRKCLLWISTFKVIDTWVVSQFWLKAQCHNHAKTIYYIKHLHACLLVLTQPLKEELPLYKMENWTAIDVFLIWNRNGK